MGTLRLQRAARLRNPGLSGATGRPSSGGGPVAPTLGALSLSPSVGTVGTAFAGTISGATTGSTITLSGAGAAGLTVSGASVSGTPTAAGAVNLIETLAGATGSPRTTAGALTVSAAPISTPYDLNFAAATYQTPTGSVADPVAAGLLSVTRPSALTVPDSTGKYTTYTAGTLARNDVGLWQRKATRTNLVRNNSMAGTATGSPGTLPSGTSPIGWVVAGAAPSGITIAVAAFGAADPDRGLPYIDLAVSGTAAANGNYTLQFGGNTLAAATGTTIAMLSAWLGLPAGSLPNDGTSAIRLQGSFINSVNAAQGSLQVADDRVMNRDATVRRHKVILNANLLTSAQQSAVAYVKPQIILAFKSGGTYSYTLRIAAPQLEAVAAITDDASHPILTTNAAVTAQADTVTLAGGALTYVQSGTGTLEPTTTDLRGSGIDFRDERPIITFNGSIRALKRTADGRLASELAGAPQTYKSWRTQFGWTQTHAVAWDASGAKVASTSPALATAPAAGAIPAISSVSLDVDGALKRLVIRNSAADLSAYNNITADVVMYGATSGGIVGAAAAIRAGATSRVIGGWREVQPGGMATGGLGAVDASDVTVFGGLARDYVAWTNEYEGKSDLNGKTVSSKTALRYFDYLVRKHGINQHWSKGVTTASKDATARRVTGFATTLGQTVSAKVVLDNSYEGDLMAAAGVSFTVGREAQDSNNPFNGNRGSGTYTTASAGISEHQCTPTTGGTYTQLLTVDPYVTPGSAGSGLLPGIGTAGVGTTGAGDAAIQAYNFRMTVTTVAALKAGATPLATAGSPPPGYSAQTYELLGRYLAAITAAGYSPVAYTVTPGANQYSIGLFVILNQIGNYYDLNANNGFSTDTFGANWGPGWAAIMQAAGVASPSANYAVASYAEREIFWKWQENFQRGLFYWLAYSGDSRIPAQISGDAALFGLANDHYLDPHENDTANWMTQLYVREARRMVGVSVLSAADVTATDGTAPRSLNTIGIGSYGIDSHHVRRFVDTSTGTARTVNEGNLFQTPAGNKYFPVSAEYLMPQQSEATNLLVTFAASARHTGFGALRMEMAHMGSAEAAGIMGAQVAKQAAQPDIQAWVAGNYGSDIRPALLAVGINAPQTN